MAHIRWQRGAGLDPLPPSRVSGAAYRAAAAALVCASRNPRFALPYLYLSQSAWSQYHQSLSSLGASPPSSPSSPSPRRRHSSNGSSFVKALSRLPSDPRFEYGHDGIFAGLLGAPPIRQASPAAPKPVPAMRSEPSSLPAKFSR